MVGLSALAGRVDTRSGGVAPVWYGVGPLALAGRVDARSRRVVPVWYGVGPLALAGRGLLCSEGPKARYYSSLGQRPRKTDSKKFGKGQGPAPSLLDHFATFQRPGNPSDLSHPAAGTGDSAQISPPFRHLYSHKLLKLMKFLTRMILRTLMRQDQR